MLGRLTLVSAAAFALAVCPARAQRTQSPEDKKLSAYLQDRGTGIPTSMFATYVRTGELLVYPFVEYYYDNNAEYKPSSLGYGVDQDFRGRFRSPEALIFASYGVADWLAIEAEAAVTRATLHKSASDPSAAPSRLTESGLGDVEGQVRVRWAKETERRPDVFSYFEVVAPLQKKKVLIGTQDWEFKFGSGVVKGFSWGTVTLRLGAEYLREDGKLALGEYAAEYMKLVSPRFRLYLGVEGTQDELGLIPEVQWHVSKSVYVKLNTGIALTSKGTDLAPELGLMFSFPVRRE